MFNMNILGHPINIATILFVIALIWFAFFALNKMGVIPSHADGSAT